jgi:hypothetical protein
MTSTTKANVGRLVNEKNDCITCSNVVEIAKATRFMTILACRLPDVSLRRASHDEQEFKTSTLLCMNRPLPRPLIDQQQTIWRCKQEYGEHLTPVPGHSFRWSKWRTPADIMSAIHVGARHDHTTWQTDSCMQGKCNFCSQLVTEDNKYVLLACRSCCWRAVIARKC